LETASKVLVVVNVHPTNISFLKDNKPEKTFPGVARFVPIFVGRSHQFVWVFGSSCWID
jgi:hypothetical protein